MSRLNEQTTFDSPQTLGNICSTYHMVNLVGMPGGHAAHYHPDTIEICYVLRGRLSWWIGESSYDVHSGDVLVMPAGVPHGSNDQTLQPCEYFVIHVKPEGLSEGAFVASKDPRFGGNHPGQSHIGDLVKRVFEEHKSNLQYREEICHSMVNLLVVQLARHGASSSTEHPENYLLKKAMRLLADDSEGSRTVEQVAKSLRVSTVWLTNVFQKELGQSPGEWIRSKKLSEAKHLLSHSGDSIIEIAVHLGFASSQYFATAFKRDTGLTPKEYRARTSLRNPTVATVSPIR